MLEQPASQQVVTDMYALKHSETPQCSHSTQSKPSGLCVITVGNTLRGDDGVAVKICNNVPLPVFKDVCRFDLGTYTSYLGACLQGHKAAIIIDSTSNSRAPGSITIVDLNAYLEDESGGNLTIRSTHGLSLVDELKLLKEVGTLPERLMLLGVEVKDAESEKVSLDLQSKVPQLVSNLSFVVERIMETLKKNA